MDAQAGYQAAVERGRLLPTAALVPGVGVGVNPPMLSPTFGDTPVGLGGPYPGQTMAELAAAGGGGLSPTAVAYIPFHNRYVPAAHALALHGSGEWICTYYVRVVVLYCRCAVVILPM
ncbi:hypothetical protein NP493_648g00007 [Ridgeia piscesae]|uniref:Uncharacterized protein n=1 Tax=Ridgeia piscesae TaxID=27915 RepID=A0AAD9KTX1_RIDPI|nr:hypothetical protein NP493_648g00007 [Ridgeia piscesae]